jgi:hypothetical protein
MYKGALFVYQAAEDAVRLQHSTWDMLELPCRVGPMRGS